MIEMILNFLKDKSLPSQQHPHNVKTPTSSNLTAKLLWYKQTKTPTIKFFRKGFYFFLKLFIQLKYKIPLSPKIIKSTFHAFIKTYPRELQAMTDFAEEFPNNETALIVDAYDFRQGVDNAIKVCQKLQRGNKKREALIFFF